MYAHVFLMVQLMESIACNVMLREAEVKAVRSTPILQHADTYGNSSAGLKALQSRRNDRIWQEMSVNVRAWTCVCVSLVG